MTSGPGRFTDGRVPDSTIPSLFVPAPAGTVGSSTMPQKRNPQLAAARAQHMARLLARRPH